MEEGYVYRIAHKDGEREFLASIDEVKDLLRQHDETNNVLACFAGDPADGDDGYNFTREELAKLGIRMVRTVAEGYEEVFTLTEYKEEPHRFLGLKTGGLVPVSEEVASDPRDFVSNVRDLVENLDLSWNYAHRLMQYAMSNAEDFSFQGLMKVCKVIEKLVTMADTWSAKILYADYDRKRYYFILDPEDDGYYGYYRALRHILAEKTMYRLTKQVRVKRNEFEVTLPIDLIHRYQQVTGNDVDDEHLESILERLLERSIEDGVKE